MIERRPAKMVPWLIVGLCALYLLWPLRPSSPTSGFDVQRFGRLPVTYMGRTKPFDTVARNSLTIISNQQTLKRGGEKIAAMQWLLDVLARPEVAHNDPVFRIDHPGVLGVLGFQDSGRKRFSFNQVMVNARELDRQARLARRVPANERDLYQRKLLELYKHLDIYMGLADYRTLYLVAPENDGHSWLTLPAAMTQAEQTGMQQPSLRSYQLILSAYHNDEPQTFNREVAALHAVLKVDHRTPTRAASFESVFNHYGPFYRAMVLYLGVILITFLSWLVWRGPLLTAANRLLVLTWLVHTVALAVRVYLSGRPPVTNLYSSAIFIGWGCVVLCLILERVFRNGLGTFTAATTGALTLLVARALSGDGDSMAVLQAVLDTNFWLATHVVVITLGYSATFLAGVLGIIFVFRGVFTNTLSKDSARSLGQMIYGIVCFATLFSFVGTILGGIWADQSWGRFWGWDPKENGALMIVLWNVLLLHARWGGMVKLRGMAVLAIFGNVVTSWSWFGVNMLGAGLHSYGFIESAVFWLLLFVASQLAMIGIGCLPPGVWCSFSAVAPQHLPEGGQQ